MDSKDVWQVEEVKDIIRELKFGGEGIMKIRGIVAVMLLSAVSMWGQAAPAAPDASKPADHPACKHDKEGKMECCKKDKAGNMVKEMDCCKKGKCAREKKDSEKKS
jgi:hypothetical protein